VRVQSYGDLILANWHMANWRIWQTDCGKSAYGELAFGETTSYLKDQDLVSFLIYTIGTVAYKAVQFFFFTSSSNSSSGKNLNSFQNLDGHF